MHGALRLSSIFLLPILLASCGRAVEELPVDESLETQQGAVETSLDGPCSASLVCSSGTTISCISDGAPDTCFTGTNFVSCDDRQKYCPTGVGGCTGPIRQDI